MKLYFVDSKNSEKLIADDIQTEEDAVQAIVKHNSKLFIVLSTPIKIDKQTNTLTCFNANNESLRYVLKVE